MTRRDPDIPEEERRGFTRRRLLGTAAMGAAAGALLRPARALAGEPETVAGIGPEASPVSITVNGEKRKLVVEPRQTLLDALRADLDLTGAKRVCDRGTCGACTVWLDGRPVYSCSVLAVEAEGREVTTVEGLGTPDAMHPVQAAFVASDALQCGFCTPGFVMSTAAAVRDFGSELNPSRLLRCLSGNLCRCGTYSQIMDAALSAARAGKGR